MIRIIILFLLFLSVVKGQTYILEGKVLDAVTERPLSYANIRVKNSYTGTAANNEGEFKIISKSKIKEVEISFIGYTSVTVDIKDKKYIVVKLTPINIELPEATVLPKENPANEIIRRVIGYKKERKKKIKSYSYKAYTKGIIKTTREIGIGANSISTSIGKKDTAKLKITGIFENESIGYFLAPDKFKEKIIARKQTANFPSYVNFLTGSRILPNFYAEEIDFADVPLPSPISENALDYYYFMILDTLVYKGNPVFKIDFEPINSSDPGYKGLLFVNDKTFSLLKIETSINKAGNRGGILDSIFIMQQYHDFDDYISFPIDYRFTVKGNVMGIFKFRFDVSAIFHDFDVNEEIPDDYFDRVVIEVNKDADSRDSLYWKTIPVIPPTKEEIITYNRIDSLKEVKKDSAYNYSLLALENNLSDNISITGPLGIYGFNRVEGHKLNFGVNGRDFFNKRFNFNANISYGFSDKKLKKEVLASYYFGDYRQTGLRVNIFDETSSLFEKNIYFAKYTSTLYSLLYKDDFRDYYYTKGIDLSLSADLSYVMNLELSSNFSKDKSAKNNSDFSFFKKDSKYPKNLEINNGLIHEVSVGLNFDFRKIIKDGMFIRRISGSSPFVLFGLKYSKSDGDFLFSDFNYSKVEGYLNFNGRLFSSVRSRIRFTGIKYSGDVPFQKMYALPGSMNSNSRDFTFRTQRINRIIGDNVFVVTSEHNFKDELFRVLGLRFLSNMNLSLSVHFNAAKSKINSKTIEKLNFKPYQTGNTYYELGFGIYHMLFPLKIDFTWRLSNQKFGDDFNISLNTIVL